MHLINMGLVNLSINLLLILKVFILYIYRAHQLQDLLKKFKKNYCLTNAKQNEKFPQWHFKVSPCTNAKRKRKNPHRLFKVLEPRGVVHGARNLKASSRFSKLFKRTKVLGSRTSRIWKTHSKWVFRHKIYALPPLILCFKCQLNCHFDRLQFLILFALSSIQIDLPFINQ